MNYFCKQHRFVVMKVFVKIIAVAALLAGSVCAHAQKAVYTFLFDSIKMGETEEYTDGTGSIVIYDNQTVTVSATRAKSKTITYSFQFSSFATLEGKLGFHLYYGTDCDDNNKNIFLALNGCLGDYSDKASGIKIVFYDEQNRNQNAMETCLDAMSGRTGVFRNFASEADRELPLTVNGYNTGKVFTVPANGGDTVYPIRTKTGKMVCDTKIGDYTATSDSYWCEINTKTDAAILLRTSANTTGYERKATITVEAGGKTTTVRVSQPSCTAVVKNVWVEHNKFSGLVKGMRIHFDFETYNMRGRTGECGAYFFFANGQKLMDYNYQYRALDGQVCVCTNFTPGYDNTSYNDVQLFMPYSELHINGSATCKFYVQIAIGGQYAISQEYSFTYN